MAKLATVLTDPLNKIMKYLLIAIAVMPLLHTGCMSTASSQLKRMKASDYFYGHPQLSLMKAIEDEDPYGIEEALHLGANVNKVGKDQMTPLMWSMIKGKKTSYAVLLKKGANPNYMTLPIGESKAEVSVMKLASMMEDAYYLELALNHGGNPNMIISNISKETILFSAIRSHRFANVKILLSAGGGVNHRSKNGLTPIMAAGYSTRYDMVYYLMGRGADLSVRQTVRDENGRIRKGKTLAEQVERGGNSIAVLGKEKEQRQWYNICPNGSEGSKNRARSVGARSGQLAV